jgi:predicted O-methyltransferase YrrM
MSTLRALIKSDITDKDTTHSYLEPYEELFAPRRQTARRVLEVGVQTGGSLLLWRDYFPAAEVVGVDRNPSPAGGERIRCLQADAYTDETVESLRALGPFDVLIDDGSHALEHLKFFAARYTELLAPGGVLVIEDVETIDWVDAIRQAFPADVRDRVQVLDRRHVKGRYDDILMVLQV